MENFIDSVIIINKLVDEISQRGHAGAIVENNQITGFLHSTNEEIFALTREIYDIAYNASTGNRLLDHVLYSLITKMPNGDDVMRDNKSWYCRIRSSNSKEFSRGYIELIDYHLTILNYIIDPTCSNKNI